MSEAQQESRLKIEVDPSAIIPEYRERVARAIEDRAENGDPVYASDLFCLAAEIRTLGAAGEGTHQAGGSSGPKAGGCISEGAVARRRVAKLLKGWRSKLSRARELEAEARRLRQEAEIEADEIMPLIDRYA
ncbi:hypothetical protein FIU88_08105 [Halomonas sp. THAF12]|uniref:hypothetical protein n=1 Tax=Halomonas sp. THAF12 TaxID=2587849 RepID=UPI0012695D80|nr:hypothetical protein [Halomonas sp. THAF12]QFT84936.1 hypothetical protein FIU88_08105 [Halomonas sp. THAF12]